MNERLMILAVSAAAAIVFVALGMPLAGRRVPPNWIYGFRLPQTVNDPRLWYPANAYAGRWLIALGAVTLAAAFTGYFLPVQTATYAVAVVSVAGGLAVVMVVACMVWLARRLRSRKNGAPRERA